MPSTIHHPIGSKSGFLNHLIEEDMKQHPDIVEMSAALRSMKE